MSVDFDEVFIGAERRKTFQLLAPGALPVRYRTSLSGEAFGFQAGPANGVIGANNAQEVVVVFRPGRPGVSSATLLFDSDATDPERSSVAVTIRGVGVLPPDCEDGNGCTADRFDLDMGRCVHEFEPISCDDFDQCTTADTCAEGVCLGRAVNCDDDNPCTDDFCDPATGCVHRPTGNCDDGNPCTIDTCTPSGACRHITRDDGAPCNDGANCTMADICLQGVCAGVNVPDGTPCDDADPCTTEDQCLEGICRDPTVTPPEPGDIRFEARIGELAPGAATNPIVDSANSVFVATVDGIVSIDRCGDVAWENNDIQRVRWSGALSLPGRLSVPAGRHVVDLVAMDGTVRDVVDLEPLFGVQTASTATSAVRVLDLAARASGALVVSAVEVTPSGELTGLLAEIDANRSRATLFRRLGPQYARRVAIDRDEAVVAILATGDPFDAPETERLVRFGIEGLDGTTWATAPLASLGSDLAIDSQGRVIWSLGLGAFSKRGAPYPIHPRGGANVAAGGPVIGADDQIVAVLPRDPPMIPGTGNIPPGQSQVVSTSTSGRLWKTELSVSAEGMTPVIDADGTVHLLAYDGSLYSLKGGAVPSFVLRLPFDPSELQPTTLAISNNNVIIVPGPDSVIGVQSTAPIAPTAWPRRRRDNLSTGHR